MLATIVLPLEDLCVHKTEIKTLIDTMSMIKLELSIDKFQYRFELALNLFKIILVIYL